MRVLYEEIKYRRDDGDNIIRLYMRDGGRMVDVCNMTRDHFYGSWDDEEGSENVIIDASINIKVNHIENHEKGQLRFWV